MASVFYIRVRTRTYNTHGTLHACVQLSVQVNAYLHTVCFLATILWVDSTSNNNGQPFVRHAVTTTVTGCNEPVMKGQKPELGVRHTGLIKQA